MKKAIALLITATSLVFLLFGCGQETDVGAAKRLSNQLIEYIENEDYDGIKSILCEENRESEDIDEEIDTLFKFLGSDINFDNDSYEIDLSGSGGTYTNGVCTHQHISAKITNLCADNGRIYSINFYAFTVNEDDESKVGIHKINLYQEFGIKLCSIGDYIDE